jgi:DNA-binding MarR family transcriptional regulator
MTDREAQNLEAFQLLGKIISRADPGRLEAWAGYGLTLTQLRLLFILRTEDGSSAGALAEAIRVTPSTLTRIMDRIVKGGLVRREADESDRRLVRHFLTPAGSEAVAEIERLGRARMDAVFSRLEPEQLDRLITGLRDLMSAAESLEAEAEAADALKVAV